MQGASYESGTVESQSAEIRADYGLIGRSEDVESDTNVFGRKGTALEYFARETFRTGQSEAIEQIEQAFEQGYKYVVVRAPTGSGKSQIARAFAFQSGNAYVITPQKILQDQYREDFPEMHIIKGRNEYEAMYQTDVDSYRAGTPDRYQGPVVTCADCICQKIDVDNVGCPYRTNIHEAYSHPVVVHNFDSFFYQNMRNGWPKRSLLVIDEAHAIENKLMGFIGFKISNRFIENLHIPNFDHPHDYDDVLDRWYNTFAREASELESLKKGPGLTGPQAKRLDQLRRLVSKVGMYLLERKKENPTEYVIDYSDAGGFQSIEFRPVVVQSFAHTQLFLYADRVLMMSATLDEDVFVRSVGLSPDDVAFIDIPSTFPVDNNKIVRAYVGSMNFKSINRTLPLLVEKIEEILSRFPRHKGIIQTHTERIAEYIRYNLKSDRLTFNKDYPTPALMLEDHAQKAGSFIVASGLREGIDLSGSLSRIQIICKVPYPSLADSQVSRRMEIDKPWYGYQTALSFVQAVGRSVRSEDDKAITYILDEGFTKFWNMNKRFIPPHIREAIKNG